MNFKKFIKEYPILLTLLITIMIFSFIGGLKSFFSIGHSIPRSNCYNAKLISKDSDNTHQSIWIDHPTEIHIWADQLYITDQDGKQYICESITIGNW